jgi:DNA (cytosine-5)-methyltransferase 1
MHKPRLLDLFCCQGGATRGYQMAGFAVTGVDVAPQPLYCGDRFIQADALEFIAEHGHEYDVLHASPPCQASTTMSNRWRGKGGKADEWVSLIVPTREALIATGKPWILENVPGARSEMVAPIALHGGMFGLRVNRPRLFDSNMDLAQPPRAAKPHDPIGVYGKLDGRRLFTRADGTSQYAARSLEQAQAAMEMSWADWDGCREAIPPAYTHFLGLQIMQALRVAA